MKGLVAILLVFSTALSQTPAKPKGAVTSTHPVNNKELYSRARLARSSGNLGLERLLLLRSLSGDRPTAFAAARRLAANASERDRNTESIDLLTLGTADPNIPVSRDDEALLGGAYLKSRRSDLATAIFSRIGAGAVDDASVRAVRGLDLIGLDISEAEHLRRASIYQANRDFGPAKVHYQAVIDAAPNGTSAADGAFQIGRGYALSADYTEAVNWFERVLEQYPQTPAAKDALLQAAAAYSRVGKSKEAIKRYQRFIELYPADEKTERAYLNIVDVHRDLGEDFEALKWCAKTEAIFRGKTPEAVAIFAEARIYSSRNDWTNALSALDRLRPFADLGGTTPGGTSSAEVNFLRGVYLEELGRRDEAIEAYRSVPNGRASYYGGRAEDRLRQLAASTVHPAEQVEPLRALYPTSFASEVLRYAKPRGVDPRFVMSIMRQESRFDPFAHSTASARGLMQLIMTTATKAGGEIGENSIVEDDLYDPAFSILIGTQHLADLFKAFPEQPEAVAAAYNASEENVRRWTARAKSGSADRYVSEIMFAQTKDYVEKVMSNYRMYQYLYDEELKPR